MERALNKEELLVGVNGKDALKDAFQTLLLTPGPNTEEDTYRFIKEFSDLRGLRDSSIEPVIELLEAGGVPRGRFTREIMSSVVNIMRKKIPHLNQAQLKELLDNSYSYLTVPELAPVAVATLENMRNVRPDMWTEIVNNGLTESPYIELPITIKRRIWMVEPSAFEHELEFLISELPELPAPTIEVLMKRSTFESRRTANKPLKDLQQLANGMGENTNLLIAEKLYERAGSESSVPKRLAIANLFHDFTQTLHSRNEPLLSARRIAIELDKPPKAQVDGNVLQNMRDSLPLTAQYPLLMLLTSSTYSRDSIADRLVARLGRLGEKYRLGSDDEKSRVIKNLHHDRELHILTYLCLFTMRITAILSGRDVVQDAEVEVPMGTFFPIMIQEIANDRKWYNDEYHREDARVPDPKLHICITQGRLGRRVISTYCLHLLEAGNVVGTRRFHHILDKMLRLCDPVEEIRELTLARAICEHIMMSKQPPPRG